eukprot:Hpha_TRINITY_DN18951_c0_g1::TRINITY_DN18951_c0_g1_i1::g.17593::m.17593
MAYRPPFARRGDTPPRRSTSPTGEWMKFEDTESFDGMGPPRAADGKPTHTVYRDARTEEELGKCRRLCRSMGLWGFVRKGSRAFYKGGVLDAPVVSESHVDPSLLRFPSAADLLAQRVYSAGCELHVFVPHGEGRTGEGEDAVVWLNEIHYFMKVTETDFEWLLRRAALPGDPRCSGDEAVSEVCPVTSAILRRVEKVTSYGPPGRALVVPRVTEGEFAVLQRLERLSFRRCGGIAVCKAPSAGLLSGQAALHARLYHEAVVHPAFLTPEVPPPHAPAYMERMRIPSGVALQAKVGLLHQEAGRNTYLFILRGEKGIDLPGGEKKTGLDSSPRDTARREWEEEVPGFAWGEAVDREIGFHAISHPGQHSSALAIVVCKARAEFFEATKGGLPLEWGKGTLTDYSTSEEKAVWHHWRGSTDMLYREHESAEWIRVQSPEGYARGMFSSGTAGARAAANHVNHFNCVEALLNILPPEYHSAD